MVTMKPTRGNSSPWSCSTSATIRLDLALVKHARYYWLLLAEGHLTRQLFGDMLQRIWALPVPGG